MWNSTGGFGGEYDGGYDNNTTTGGGGGGGGGFMSSSQIGSPSTGAAKKEYKDQNSVNTTIRSILESETDGLFIEGMEVNSVVLVGIIRSVSLTNTRIVYSLEDASGVIGVIRYPDGDMEEDKAAVVSEGMYARVYGPIRNYEGKRNIIAFKVEQITDHNIVTSHILQVIYQRMHLKKLSAQSDSTESGSGALLANSSLMNQPSASASINMGTDRDMVYAAIKSCTSDQGMSKTMIVTVLKGKMTVDKIERMVEELSGDGIIYTTHDDDHFLVVED